VKEFRMVEKLVCVFFAVLFLSIQVTVDDNGDDFARRSGRSNRSTRNVRSRAGRKADGEFSKYP
jgi:hypothetical protein